MNKKKEPEPFYKQAEAFWKKYKTPILIFSIIAILCLIFNPSLIFGPGKKTIELNFSEFLYWIEQDKIAEVTITGNRIKGKDIEETSFKTVSPPGYNDLIKILREHKVTITVKETGSWFNGLIIWLPLVLIIVFWMFFMRRMQAGGNKALSFGKSKAKLFKSDEEKKTFKDVAGIKEAKEELQEIIAFLKNPKAFQKLGGKIPKGVLIVGPPGCGKTLLARAVAGEANVPFLSLSGSDFVEMFVGVGASRVRDLFETGKKHAPCLIFIDELDAVGRQRGAGLGGGHDEREQTLNALLVEMDGFDPNEGIILIAATNRPDILDKALLRPGRFDRQVIVPLPDIKGRKEILRVHTRKIPLAKNVRLGIIARSTPGFSGADLANLANEAALFAARQGHDEVMTKDIEHVKDKILMGVERKSMIISEKEKRNTAFHEAGHALVATEIPEADPIHKVTIIPRGIALGITQLLPLEDRHTYSKNYLKAQLAVLLAGREAEELFLKQQTTGATNDFERATEIARKMVCQWGMSDLGVQNFEGKEEETFLGRDIVKQKQYSENTAQKIDDEIKKILQKAQNQAKKILENNKDKLEKLTKKLLEEETLDKKEIKKLLKIKAAQ